MYDDDRTAEDGRISTLFHYATAEVEPDVPALVRGSIDRGRGKVRRRTVGTAFVAAAAVGMVGVAASVAPGLGPDATGEPAGAPASVAAAATSTVAPPKATQPRTKPGRPPAIPTADIPVRAVDLPRLFTKLYPGQITPAEARTGRIIDDGRAGQVAHFLYNDTMVTVAFTAYAGTPAQRCGEIQQEAGQSNPPAVTCTQRPDGTVLTRGRGTGAHDGGGVSVSHHARLFTKGGYEIFAISYNWASKTGPVLSEEPPLSVAQLSRAVTSAVWFQ